MRALILCAAAVSLTVISLEGAAVSTGPRVGARIPRFEAPDQNGARRNFQSLRGPRGLALVFVRSADW